MKKTSFIIMPFSATNSCTENQWTEIFVEVFKPAMIENGYTCERSHPETGSLIKSILKKIQDSFIVIADITDRNANVFYELGVRHSLSKRTIIVAQEAKHIPSDLNGYWTIIYNTTPSGVSKFKKDIKRIIKKIEKNPFESDNPVSDFIESEMYGLTNQSMKISHKKLIALRTELSANINTLNECKTDKSYRELIDHQCLDILTNSLYVDLGMELLKMFYEYRSNLRRVKSNLSIDDTFLDKATENGLILSNKLEEVLKKISKGEFEEPQNISETIWKPQKVNQQNLEYSKLTKFDFDLRNLD
jgi:hypothetical protein